MSRNFPSFKTDQFLLREIVDSDLENIYKGLSDPEVTRHYAVHYDSLEATRAQMAWFADKKQMWWAICSADKLSFCGAGGLNDIDHSQQKAEIGLWLLPTFWGRGIMKAVLPMIADYGLDQLKLKRIEGFVETGNANCIKAMSKLDFDYERTILDTETKPGRSLSLDVYVKTK